MSPLCSSVCLLVSLGLMLASGTPVQFISERLKQNHDSIAHVLKLTQSELVTNPLFTWNSNSSCQRGNEVRLMKVTLDVYKRIFSNILQQNQHHNGARSLLDQVPQSKHSEVEAMLQDLQQKIVRLEGHLSHLNHDQEHVISALNKIKVDDLVVQRKALAQFKEIYQAASVIGHRCGPVHLPSSTQ